MKEFITMTLKADLFEDGQVYTWTLRQAYANLPVSDTAYQSFKVIKK